MFTFENVAHMNNRKQMSLFANFDNSRLPQMEVVVIGNPLGGSSTSAAGLLCQ